MDAKNEKDKKEKKDKENKVYLILKNRKTKGKAPTMLGASILECKKELDKKEADGKDKKLIPVLKCKKVGDLISSGNKKQRQRLKKKK